MSREMKKRESGKVVNGVAMPVATATAMPAATATAMPVATATAVAPMA